MAQQILTVKIVGDASQLLATARTAANQVNRSFSTNIIAGTTLAKLWNSTLNMVGKFAKSTISSFTDTANVVRTMQGTLGGTAEEMSRLKYMADVTGVKYQQLTIVMGQASRHLTEQDKYAKAFGTTLYNTNGTVKTSTQVFGELADKILSIENPIERIAAARDIFGRGFREVIPLLRLGSKGMEDLALQADKLGVTMSSADLKKAWDYQNALKQMRAAAKGLGIELGRTLIPVLKDALNFFTNLTMQVSHWARGTDDASQRARTLFKILGVGIGVIAAYKLVTKLAAIATYVFEGAQLAAAWATGILNGALEVNPILAIVTAILAAATAFVIWVKTTDDAGQQLDPIFRAIGAVAGDIFGGMAYAAGAVSIAILDIAQAAVEAYQAFNTGLGAIVGLVAPGVGYDMQHASDDVITSMNDLRQRINDNLKSVGQDAFKHGGDYISKVGQGMIEKIKNMKIPSLSDLFKAPSDLIADKPMPNAPDQIKGGGGGAKKQKSAILDFFKTLIDQARTSLQTIRDAAIQAKKEMDDMAKSVGESMAKAMSLTEVSKASFAAYTGPKALIRMFNKRLQDMRDFVSNVRKLKDMGLPPEMMKDLVDAGVQDGARLAKMLVANPGVLNELKSLQSQITVETTSAGQMVAEAVMGPRVADLTNQAIASQRQFNVYLGAAQRAGYQPTQEDIQASQTNIHNEVYMNAETWLDQATIERAVAWALKTGMPKPSGPRGPRSRRASSSGGADMAGRMQFPDPSLKRGAAGPPQPGYARPRGND